MFREVADLLKCSTMQLMSSDYKAHRTLSVLHTQLQELERLSPVTVETRSEPSTSEAMGAAAQEPVVQMDDEVYRLRVRALFPPTVRTQVEIP
jgi:hypothetical protein